MKRQAYKKSGVDINKAEIFLKKIKPLVKSTQDANVLTNTGGFGGLFKFDKDKYQNPVLVSSSDGVGTKLKIAILTNKHDTIGIDLVGMNVNDILCCGARPLFFLDYIACGRLDPKVLTSVVAGIKKGCRLAHVSLIGGETAEMPGMYKKQDYDLAGFCVGAVEKSRIIDGLKIKAHDTLIGIQSSGLHSNGFSLVRKVLSRVELKKYSRQLLKPTRIYVKPILSLLAGVNNKNQTIIKGIAHITGGAFYDKIIRILPKGLGLKIHKDAWPIPNIFKIIQQKGKIKDYDMFSTFNMGIGMVLIVDKKYTTQIIRKLYKLKLRSWAIGSIVGARGVKII